ncbi:MAG: 3-dehydroquinate synthase [Elusimicrobiota bacterium]|jgi:3-dehydroquinate synthase|nr:3-dehydroquinate synthase [Elusimicrobiota bacterium]
MKTIKLDLANPCKIVISTDTKHFLSELERIKKISNLFIIADENAAKFHLKTFLSLLKSTNLKVKTTIIKSGEDSKSIKNLARLYDEAIEEGIDRKSCAIAFGGGVIGDLAGFFSSTYMRGIKLIQVPTTLLAMTDSSVGGKTAITTSKAKNIAGTFKQPDLVWINSSYLKTLPQRQIDNGFAEVVKYAFTFDKNFFDWLLRKFQKKIFTDKDFNYIIYKCCSYKAQVVKKDERDVLGIREVLNFGHTLAHAIETQTKYKTFLHGEAVAIGMLFAAQVSVSVGLADNMVWGEVRDMLFAAGLNFNLGKFDAENLVSLMKQDKKSFSRKLSFVLLKDIGNPICGYNIDDKTALFELKKFLKGEKAQ